ncbi:MAG: deoxyguanosinetriphosphate triphosphohydrolase [Chloroflexi bacterium]|nr:MAG: deoxyguanosinetriphosphate triphosphohydrolase [Chloroflexota bacterium]
MILRREQLEEMEAERLAPYAMLSRNSRGRAHPEAEHPYRTAFQRDRDRILHTTAFRRLEYKTQVFVNYEGDYYRTRLTHTLEVAQIGRTIARAMGANEDLVEAISLAHDLGHTPFGHSGEETLHKLMANHGGFDHNRQGLRIVEQLENRYPDFRGLNLTWEVREGIAKHATEYDKGSGPDYEPEKRATIEGQIVNAADEIAYNAHDLDDGLRAGLIAPADPAELTLWQRVCESVGWDGGEFTDMTRHRIIRRLIGLEVTDVIEETDRRLRASGADSVESVRSLGEDVVAFSEEMTAMNRALKDFLMAHLYRHYRVARMAAKATRVISELFQAYVRDPAQLPTSTQRLIEHENLHRVVCDYIAGMTDRYALEEYAKLFDPYKRV